MKDNALIIIDMQNDFVSGSLGTKEAQAIVKPMLEYVKNFDGNIYFTQDTHNKNYLDSKEGHKLPVEHCIKDTYGWNIIDELKPFIHKDKTNVFEKPTFGSQQLAIYTQFMCYDNIILIGVCTGICVMTNALLLKTSLYDTTNIQVKKDLGACVSPESHETALKAMQLCQIDII